MAGLFRYRTLWLVVAFAPCCGGRSSLEPFEADASEAGTSFGGAASAGKAAAGARSAGAAAGGASGAPSGSAGTFADTSGQGGGAGEPTMGGAAGAPNLDPPAIGLALAAFHSCALFEGGSVRCWGAPGYLGTGNARGIGDDEAPRVAGDIDVGGIVKSLTAGWEHTCAVLVGGAVRCWGGGFSGQLGYGSTDSIGDDETPASAGDVPVGGAVAQVVAGPDHTCAVLVSGGLRCWGSNGFGQLGYPGNEDIGDNETPASVGDVAVGGQVQQVALGRAYTCVLLVGGRVKCWGSGLGFEDPEVELGGNAVQLVSGGHHACVLFDTGKVRCFGWGFDGSLGYGNDRPVRDNAELAAAGDVDVGGHTTQLAAGNGATCALVGGGTVRCWGSSRWGELGYGNTDVIGDDETPKSVGDVEVGGKVSLIAQGFAHTCAVLDTGRVRCWGRGGTGALGYGNLDDIGDDELPSSASDVETH